MSRPSKAAGNITHEGKSPNWWRTTRAAAWVSVGILLTVWSSGARIVGGEQPQNPFRLYVLRAGRGY
ncbi:MAG: hypothetical protein WBF35_09180, partial [Candidatus Acidiferrales bacterium]